MTMMDPLLDPPFAKIPAFRADAKIVGLVCAILAGLGTLFGLLALPITLALLGAAPILALSLIANLVGDALAAYGGWQMYRGSAEGKRWVVYGLIVAVVAAGAGLLLGPGPPLPPNLNIPLASYPVVTSRFPPAREPGPR